MHVWRRKLVLCITYTMKYLQNEARKQKSIKEVTLQFSIIFQIRLKNNNVNFRVVCPLNTKCFKHASYNEFASPYFFMYIISSYIVQFWTNHSLSRSDVLETKQKSLYYIFVWVYVSLYTVTVIELIVFSYNEVTV
jgi:hypothetical protein